jgi:hypothetical protein
LDPLAIEKALFGETVIFLERPTALGRLEETIIESDRCGG